MASVTPENFAFIAKLLREKSAISLGDDKGYLVDSRLLPVARSHGLQSVDELAQKLRGNLDPTIMADITDAMTTNETSFFRDAKPFKHFQEHGMPRLLEKAPPAGALRIWCAAASTGQEPYTLAMTLKEHAAAFQNRAADIIGTDISPTAIEKAKQALYSQFEVQRGMPIQMLLKYFKQEGEEWRLNDDIRNMVKYDTFNLLDAYTTLGQFDMIFCRNVLIYFEKETKADMLTRMRQILKPHGLLYLGSSETVIGLCDGFKPAEGLAGVFEPV